MNSQKQLMVKFNKKLTFSGRLLPSDIFPIGMALVLVAIIQCFGTTCSSSLITWCLIFIFSNTASMTISAFEKDSYDNVLVKSDTYLSFSILQ